MQSLNSSVIFFVHSGAEIERKEEGGIRAWFKLVEFGDYGIR